MKRKELRNLAEKIAKCEYVIQNSPLEGSRAAARAEIMRLSGQVKDFQDIDILDEMIQEILSKMS